MKETVTELYREIGSVFREHGANRVALLGANANPGTGSEMALELAVDGAIDEKKLHQECRRRWPQVEFRILDMNEESNMDLMDEVVEDGILL